MIYETKTLSNHVKSMGIKQGDTLLVRAGLGKIGRLVSRNKLDYINFLLEAVGEEGTIVGLSFTDGNFIRRNKSLVFTKEMKANTGGFANVMLAHPNALRSSHPTNSYVAIGKKAEYILNGHDETSGAYDPINKIIELDGKMILIGCVAESPGFTTTHLAEVDLGLHKKYIFPTLNTAYFRNENGNISLFKRKDIGGCSGTFYKLYSQYITDEKLIQGYIGSAYSIAISARDAYEVDYRELKLNPKLNMCVDKNCLLCRARRWDNIKDIPAFAIRKIVRKLSS